MEKTSCDALISADESIDIAAQNEMSSAYDLIDTDRILDGIDPSQVLLKPTPKPLNPSPYIAFRDFNNSKDDFDNCPKPAIEIGLRFEF